MADKHLRAKRLDVTIVDEDVVEIAYDGEAILAINQRGVIDVKRNIVQVGPGANA